MNTDNMPTFRDDPRAWTGQTLDESAWKVAVPEPCLEELKRAVARLERHPVPMLLLDPAEFELPACQDLLAEAATASTQGRV